MGKLSIEKIWHDEVEPFCEICCVASSELASVKTTSYVTDKALIELAVQLELFAKNKIDKLDWTSENFSLKAFYRDAIGHIRVEISAIIFDGDIQTDFHECGFFIDGFEPEMLIQFSNRVKNIEMYENIEVKGTV